MTPADIRIAVQALPARAVLGLTLWGEARGESPDGQAGVAWVIKNRAARRRQSVQQVCLARWQFSCWWGEDPNAQALRLRAERVLFGHVLNDPRWIETLTIADQVLTGARADPTGGADHYLTTALYGDEDCPPWAKTMPVTATIGHHLFLTDPGARSV